jgi:hypothetical protein
MRRNKLFWAWLFGCAFAACNAITGVGDLSVDPNFDAGVGGSDAATTNTGGSAGRTAAGAGGEAGNPTVDADGDGVLSGADCDDNDVAVGTTSERDCSGPCLITGKQRCVMGVWDQCDAPIGCECDPGETRTIDCGFCGTQAQRCNAQASWEDDGTCQGSGCEPGTTATGAACGNCGALRKVCLNTCQWDAEVCANEGECVASAVDSEAQSCGTCGQEEKRTRTCDATTCLWGSWSTWGACSTGTGCTPNTTDSENTTCGNCDSGSKARTRACDAQCSWGAWGAWGTCSGSTGCTPNATTSGTQGCGNCNLGSQSRSRTCTATCSWGTWGSWGTCADTGCTAGGQESASQSCGSSLCAGVQTRARTCGNTTCAWGSWGSWGTCSGACLFSEDFEDGNYNGWLPGTDTYARSVTTATAANGTTRSLVQTSNGSTSHQQGLYYSLAQLQPSTISWWVYPTSATVAGGYFVLTSGSTSTFWEYVYLNTTGNWRIGNSGVPEAPATINAWNHIEFRNINWTARTLDYYVNGALVAGAMPFYSATATYIDRIDLYNFGATTSYWDEIVMR